MTNRLLTWVFQAWVACVLCGLSGAALAVSARATDDAFAALLAMPSAAPESGYWDFPKPEDAPAPGSEPALIAYLDKKLKAGADLKAYRHFGTLLHHAIRAGLDRTALWLIEHGADPRQRLLNGDRDAVDLSAEYRRAAVSEALKRYVPALPVARAASASTLVLSLPDAAFEALRSAAWSRRTPGNTNERQAEAAWDAARRRLSPAQYEKLLDGEEALFFFLELYSREPQRLAQVLDALPEPLLKRHLAGAMARWANVAQASVGASGKLEYSMPTGTWRELWHRVGRPIDYGPARDLAARVQPELWSELYASGYADHHAPTALRCLLSDLPATDFIRLWPQLERHMPDVRQAAPALLLGDYRLWSGRDAVCWTRDKTQLEAKLRFLASQGVRGPVLGVDASDFDAEPEALKAAIRLMLPASPHEGAAVPAPEWVQLPTQCRFVPSPVMYAALQSGPVVELGLEKYERVWVESVQLLDMPGSTECALLVGGYSRVEEYPTGDVDSFTGPQTEPNPSCPDPTDRYEIWRVRAGRLERLPAEMGGMNGSGILVPVEQRATGRRLWLQRRDSGRCSMAALPRAYAWQTLEGSQGLRWVDETAVEEALRVQCSATRHGGVTVCRGIVGLSAEAADSSPPDPAQGVSLEDFLRGLPVSDGTAAPAATPSSEHQRYLTAVMGLDKPLLKALHARGVPGPWTAEALRQLEKARLPVPDKRRRTAWLFADRAQLARAMDSTTLSSLITWLPREDWGPIWSVMRPGGGVAWGLPFLAIQARERGLTALACDIDNAQGLICGETWGVSR